MTISRPVLLAVQLLGSVAAFVYLFSIVDVAEVWGAARTIPITTTLLAVALTALGLVFGSIRWRILLRAYAAPHRPPLFELVKLYFIGLFYNMYLPGGVGGDVIRGVVTRRSFGEAGATSAVTVVLVERVLGLGALLTIVCTVLLIAPPSGLDHMLVYAGIGMLGAIGAVGGVAVARRLATRVPFERLQRALGSLPVLEAPAWFTLAFAWSIANQLLMAVIGWILVLALAPEFRLADAIVIVPLASATAYLPITVGGAGAREAVFVTLTTAATDVDETHAATASLAMWGCLLFVGALGGVWQLSQPNAAPVGVASE